MSKKDAKTSEPPAPGSGDPFFARAEQVAETGNWDFAIQLYLDGIRRDPGNVERGHHPLRKVSLTRKHTGGKGAGMMAKLMLKGGKDPLENLIKAEGVMAKEPGNVEAMLMVLRATTALDLDEAIPWIGRILLESQKLAPRPNKRILIELATAFAAKELYIPALEAVDQAQKADPNDGDITKLVREYSTKYTLQKGKYGEEGDFTKSVENLEKQKEQYREDALVQDKRHLESQLEKARAEYLESPAVPGKINVYVDALLKFEDDPHENQAIEVLNQGHQATGAYQFKMRIGDVRVRQRTRRIRLLKEAGKDEEVLKERRALLAFELEEYAERTVNYPTDLSLRYELGKRQYIAGKIDDAIGSLQRASNDPRRKLQAMLYLGRAFAKKGWLREAAQTYDEALKGDVPELRTKELLYELGSVLEKTDDLDGAESALSRLAQIDYQYKDVRDRLDKIRQSRSQEGSA